MSASAVRGGHTKCHILTEIIVCIVLQLKMPLGKEVGLGSGHIVLDANTAPPKGHSSPAPSVRPMSVLPRRLDGSRYHSMEVGLGPGDFDFVLLWPPYAIGGPLYFCPVISIFFFLFLT